jgi:ribosomal protein S18 acetylase RimI-like enzyme
VNGLTIEPLTAEGIDDAVALWRTCGLTRPWNDPQADARLALTSPASAILAGFMDGRLIATAMTGFDGHRAWVYYLAVDPALRGAGFGQAMMQACEAWAMARGAPKLQLMVRTDNAVAVGFYDAIGYEKQDVLVLGRRLDPA